MAKKIKKSETNALSSSGPQRVSVTLPASTIEELEEIARNEGITLAEATRRSIKRDLALRRFEGRGGDVLVKFPDGQTAYILPND